MNSYQKKIQISTTTGLKRLTFRTTLPIREENYLPEMLICSPWHFKTTTEDAQRDAHHSARHRVYSLHWAHKADDSGLASRWQQLPSTAIFVPLGQFEREAKVKP